MFAYTATTSYTGRSSVLSISPIKTPELFFSKFDVSLINPTRISNQKKNLDKLSNWRLRYEATPIPIHMVSPIIWWQFFIPVVCLNAIDILGGLYNPWWVLEIFIHIYVTNNACRLSDAALDSMVDHTHTYKIFVLLNITTKETWRGTLIVLNQ